MEIPQNVNDSNLYSTWTQRKDENSTAEISGYGLTVSGQEVYSDTTVCLCVRAIHYPSMSDGEWEGPCYLGNELYWRWACWKLSRSSCLCLCIWTSTDTECRPLWLYVVAFGWWETSKTKNDFRATYKDMGKVVSQYIKWIQGRTFSQLRTFSHYVWQETSNSLTSKRWLLWQGALLTAVI